jgi:hypothetical protein
LKIEILESIACSVNGAHGPGDTVDWKPEADAKALIKAGIATAVKGGKKKTETASADNTVETADV